jgi:hypothetical protein
VATAVAQNIYGRTHGVHQAINAKDESQTFKRNVRNISKVADSVTKDPPVMPATPLTSEGKQTAGLPAHQS